MEEELELSCCSANAILDDDTVLIQDYHRDDQKETLLLIKRLYHQIRFGCTNVVCETPTCLSYEKRRQYGGKPFFRTKTPTMARAMATVMAMEHNARAKLCPSLHLLEDSEQTEQQDLIDPKSITQQLFSTNTWKCAFRGESQFHRDGYVDSEAVITPQSSSHNTPHSPSACYRRVLSLASKYQTFSDAIETDRTVRPHSVCDLCKSRNHPGRLRRFTPDNVHALHYADSEDNWRTTLELKWPYTWRQKVVATEVPRLMYSFVRRSIAFILSSPEALQQSFLCSEELQQSSFDIDDGIVAPEQPESILGIRVVTLNIFHTGCILHMLAQRFDERPAQIFPAITKCLSKCYLPVVSDKPTTSDPNSTALNAVSISTHPTVHVGFVGATHIMKVALAALVSTFLPSSYPTHPYMNTCYRTLNKMFNREMDNNPQFLETNRAKEKNCQAIVDFVFSFEDNLACDCMKTFLRVFKSRRYYKNSATSFGFEQAVMNDEIVNYLAAFADNFHLPRVILLWAQKIFKKEYNNSITFQRSSTFGCALDFMFLLYQNRSRLNIRRYDFEIPWLSESFRSTLWPSQWLSYTAVGDEDHLLSYPWLFCPSDIVTYFRTINFSIMLRAYGESSRMLQFQGAIQSSVLRQAVPPNHFAPWGIEANTRRYLVICLKRESLLETALDQLWRREKRDLLKPLRVVLEDENGQDAGGVQQEFFRLAIMEVLSPDYGLFTIDEATQIAWFRPDTYSASWKLSMIGLLMGLAVYNNITLSITFPLAFYNKLLGVSQYSTDYIRDRWPEVARSLDQLLQWSDGPIEDLSLDWTFTVDSDGRDAHINMRTGDVAISQPGNPTKWPTGAEPEPVTEANRRAYVASYIAFLTDVAITKEFDAFSEGFFTVVSRKSLTLFNVFSLKNLVEGSQEIDVFALQAATKYHRPYWEGHRLIIWFWEIVLAYSIDELKALLQFVRASERVPVRGMSEIQFLIDKAGDEDGRLPTSSTCFGMLKLPEYSNREILERNLMFAIKNTEGFGLM